MYRYFVLNMLWKLVFWCYTIFVVGVLVPCTRVGVSGLMYSILPKKDVYTHLKSSAYSVTQDEVTEKATRSSGNCCVCVMQHESCRGRVQEMEGRGFWG